MLSLLLLTSVGNDPDAMAAVYHVKVLSTSPPQIAVTATLNQVGATLQMDTTRPGDVPEVGDRGWPALVSRISLNKSSGESIPLSPDGDRGWKVAKNAEGPLTLRYFVDYTIPAKSGWPAARESGYADAEHVMLVGRSVFVTSPETSKTKVVFDLPSGWRPTVPWSRQGKNGYVVPNSNLLRANLVVFSVKEPELVRAGGFNVSITSMGYWNRVKTDVKRVVQGVIPSHVRLMGSNTKSEYSIVLLPFLDGGAESYPSSFAFNGSEPPTKQNRSRWGHTIAHEIFHFWNGWQMKGHDFPSSQWFQEGFTDYAADVAMSSSGLMTVEEFLERLSRHINNYRKLSTPLNAPGNRKGPPLYSGGALVAFCWDVKIRETTGNVDNLGDAMRTMWIGTGRGTSPYTWNDIKTALEKTARFDWNSFYDSYIRGRKPLPIAAALQSVGLREESTEGTESKVVFSQESTGLQRRTLASIVKGW